jgi:hypothetical protein
VQTVGVRFHGLAIPRGATITKAHLQFTTDEVTADATSLTVRAHASDNAPVFTTTSSSLSSRSRTTASIAWSPAAWNTAGETCGAQRTPNLAPIVQELVNRTGWSNGNAIAFLINGSGKRVAAARDRIHGQHVG